MFCKGIIYFIIYVFCYIIGYKREKERKKNNLGFILYDNECFYIF